MIFLVFRFYQCSILSNIIGGGKDFMGRMKKFARGDSDGWRFGHFLIDGGGSSTPTRPLCKTLCPQNFLSHSECLILLQKVSPERLYHFNSFFVWQFRIMIETYRISLVTDGF